VTTPPVPVAVVAGHGRFADGVVSAVEQIAGRGSSFVTVSNAGLGPQDIERTIAEALLLARTPVVFTDLPAGSCTMAVRRLLRTRPDVVLVTGTSVGLLLEFLFAADGPLEEPVTDPAAVLAIARAAVERARLTLAVHGGEP
jgi:N-acetylgalactosamine PTS system EIIA component